MYSTRGLVAGGHLRVDCGWASLRRSTLSSGVNRSVVQRVGRSFRTQTMPA